jgi:acyl-CoA thioester hydrolase
VSDPALAGRTPPRCPRCGSSGVETISLFGTQAITSQFRCPECGECFEGLKYLDEPGPSRPEPARITIRRLVEWGDTDASGYYQNVAVIRWIQAAEAELHTRLGIVDLTFGSTPRVRFEVDFTERLWFNDAIDIDLEVRHLGRTSVRYGFTVRRGTVVAARGVLIAAYLPRGEDRPRPWPDVVRRALGGVSDADDAEQAGR